MKDRAGNDLKVGQEVTVKGIVRGVYADFAELEVAGTDEEIRQANHRPVIRLSGSLVDGASEPAQAAPRSGIDAANQAEQSAADVGE